MRESISQDGLFSFQILPGRLIHGFNAAPTVPHLFFELLDSGVYLSHDALCPRFDIFLHLVKLCSKVFDICCQFLGIQACLLIDILNLIEGTCRKETVTSNSELIFNYQKGFITSSIGHQTNHRRKNGFVEWRRKINCCGGEWKKKGGLGWVDRRSFVFAAKYNNNLTFNQMISLTFASFKNNKDPSVRPLIKKPDTPVPSFKALGQSKEPQKSLFLSKRLDNQENTLTNISNTQQFPRKNYIKVQNRSNKKTASKALQYTSPLRRPFEHFYTQSKPLQQSNYCAKSYTQRQEEPQIMTPNLTKTSKSFAVEESFDSYYLTQKQKTITDSENGSVESCKNSFNDSFQLCPNEEEDRVNREDNSSVINSLELHRDPTEVKNDLSQQPSMKSMKKSMYFCCNDVGNTLKEVSEKSVSGSVTSIASMKFSEKFKHYKKKPTLRPDSDGRFTLKDFKLIQEIGSGKYGKVSLAIHQSTGFLCALKSVSKRIIRQQKLQVPFMREVKIQLYLDHPNIVKLYGLFHDRENVYLIMEYCSGNHLYKKIKQTKQFSEDEIFGILSNVFEGVAYIHCNGVIHRDIKPENIVIEHGVYKLCDFGWAAYACGDPRTTFCGTPLYVCPEVLKGEEYNEKADIWGLGIVTYELTFGKAPFQILNQSDLMKIIKDQVYFPIWGQASEKLVPWVKRMLSKNAEERPSLNEILSSELFISPRNVPNDLLKRELSGLY